MKNRIEVYFKDTITPALLEKVVLLRETCLPALAREWVFHRNDVLFVCRRGQKVVAIRRARLFKKHAEITDNCVQESFRGEGLSSLMLSHAKEYISRSYPNIRYFVLYIKKSNPLFGMLKAYHERNRAVVIRETDKYVVLRYDA